MKYKWALGVLLAILPATVGFKDLRDAPYVFLTGYTRLEIERMSYLEGAALEERIGLTEAPGGFSGLRDSQGRAAHSIASYLGTRRWGPDVTLLFGYLREYVPSVLGQRDADPVDLAANFAGVNQALREAEARR